MQAWLQLFHYISRTNHVQPLSKEVRSKRPRQARTLQIFQKLVRFRKVHKSNSPTKTRFPVTHLICYWTTLSEFKRSTSTLSLSNQWKESLLLTKLRLTQLCLKDPLKIEEGNSMPYFLLQQFCLKKSKTLLFMSEETWSLVAARQVEKTQLHLQNIKAILSISSKSSTLEMVKRVNLICSRCILPITLRNSKFYSKERGQHSLKIPRESLLRLSLQEVPDYLLSMEIRGTLSPPQIRINKKKMIMVHLHLQWKDQMWTPQIRLMNNLVERITLYALI